MDAWFDEAATAKDPQKHINVVLTTRELRVEVSGVEVAKTNAPRLLFEGDLPVYIYIRKSDVHMELLKQTEHTTRCPYKGIANYYTLELSSGEKIDNMMWCYEEPISEEATGIKGLFSFYDSKANLYLDGVLLAKPANR
ncbi:hypothetical protein EVJ58_g1453 [Rhodofomes roseus]|uniref:DUF427 domain-containing protein n=1 Tax=Rhodofomes roseus TaxID=34475 RepID=A0A4Y9YZ96_9APHY|nr:hypothetical protein EVJ58_g1453 [Rhodofomes roseus]